MSATRRLLTHLAILAVASLGAVYVWTRDKNVKSTIVSDVTVWGGKAADVQRISFESKVRKIKLESRTDETGRWFEGTVEKQSPAPKPAADAGSEPPAAEAKSTTVQIVSIKSAEKIAEAIAPLRAIRELGRVSGDRAADFGLADPEGTLSMLVGSRERKLLIGGAAPGGTDRYVKDAETELVYAVQGDFLRDLLSGESVLNERELHGFDEEDLQGIRIQAGGKSRELTRGGGPGSRIWADPSTPDKAEETVSTWMTKIGKLRPSEYVAALPGAPEPNLFLRIEYVGKKGNLGFLELFRFPTGDDKKADWFLRTERTRKFAKVFASSAEPVEQDVSSIVR